MQLPPLPDYTRDDYRRLITLLCPPDVYARLLMKVIQKASEGDMQAFAWLSKQVTQGAPKAGPVYGRLPELDDEELREIRNDNEKEVYGYVGIEYVEPTPEMLKLLEES